MRNYDAWKTQSPDDEAEAQMLEANDRLDEIYQILAEAEEGAFVLHQDEVTALQQELEHLEKFLG